MMSWSSPYGLGSDLVLNVTGGRHHNAIMMSFGSLRGLGLYTEISRGDRWYSWLTNMTRLFLVWSGTGANNHNSWHCSDFTKRSSSYPKLYQLHTQWSLEFNLFLYSWDNNLMTWSSVSRTTHLTLLRGRSKDLQRTKCLPSLTSYFVFI